MAMNNAIVIPTIAAARRRKYDENVLLAIVEIESGGRAIEPADNKTPELLFERHIFYRYLPDSKKAEALRLGLTYGSKWDRSRQYKDEGTSAQRLALLARARALDEEAADDACSWGLGQTMGFLAEEMGFKNARDMVTKMTEGGIPVQIECMCRELDNKHLGTAIANRDWATIALRYNGAAYRQNQYDTKLAAAYARWCKVTKPSIPATGTLPVPLPKAPPPPATPPAEPAQKGQVPPNSPTKSGTGGVVGGVAGGVVAAGAGLSWSVIIPIVLIVAIAVGGFIYWRNHTDKE